MISTMPSSEVFPVSSQSQCASSPYRSLLDTWLRKDYQCLMLNLPAEQTVLCNSISVCGGGLVTPGRPDDCDLAELLDQLELEDITYDPSKPLCIDPQVLKVDFSRFSLSNHDRTVEVKNDSNRSSRHLSGGGILADCNCQVFQDCQTTLTDDRISDMSTNPFKIFMNPFDGVQLAEVQSIACRSAAYENVPQSSGTTPSQCSTRAASPLPTTRPSSPTLSVYIPADSSSSSTPSQCSPSTNPFLLNTSPSTLDTNPFKFPPNQDQPNSFVFAVPVLPLLQTSSCEPEPVYQNNPSTQLRKLMMHHEPSEYDLKCLGRAVKELRSSGWYYESVSWQDSIALLSSSEPGTFLLRDSNDPNFLFALSVQTSRGPTSVRLHYINGHFRLDAETKLIPHMPCFGSVIELVDYYIRNTRRRKSKKGKKAKEQVWIDSEGNIYSNIRLVRPLRKKEVFPSLQHLSRLVINTTLQDQSSTKERVPFKVTPVYESSPFQDSSLDSADFSNEFSDLLGVEKLSLPLALVQYLKQYPFCH